MSFRVKKNVVKTDSQEKIIPRASNENVDDFVSKNQATEFLDLAFSTAEVFGIVVSHVMISRYENYFSSTPIDTIYFNVPPNSINVESNTSSFDFTTINGGQVKIRRTLEPMERYSMQLLIPSYIFKYKFGLRNIISPPLGPLLNDAVDDNLNLDTVRLKANLKSYYENLGQRLLGYNVVETLKEWRRLDYPLKLTITGQVPVYDEPVRLGDAINYTINTQGDIDLNITFETVGEINRFISMLGRT